MKAAAQILSHIRSHLGFFVLLIILLSVAIANFSNTWLTGWDTLHPEFDYSLNISRLLNGAWREDQGVGAVPAHSHMSDLPRVLMLALLDVVLPTHSVKLVYDLACFILGPLGIYAFAYWQVFRKQKPTTRTAAAFVSGLVYAFNLGTMQHFYVVFEMFAVQFAALGWLFLAASRYLETQKRAWLLFFAFASVLAAPMAYASTLWFAYAGCLFLYLVGLSVLTWHKVAIGRIGVLLAVLLGTNAFWLLPNLYFLLSGAAQIPQDSHINQLFSPEAFLHNKAFGTLLNVALLKNFLFNWLSFAPAAGFTPLLQPWIQHLQAPLVAAIGYSVFLFGILGAGLSSYKRNRSVMALLPVVAISIFMLINENPPFTAIFQTLRSYSSFFEEGLRFPFTKFSLVFMMGFSILVSSCLTVFDRFKSSFAISISVGAMTVALLWYSFPMFQGQLIAPKMRAEIPTAYADFFAFAKTLPRQSRIAQFPLNTLHGWNYHDWGYEGPGFVWFGIPQPLLVRDFDRWSAGNESFYNQARTALDGMDSRRLASTLQSYDVSFVLLDRSIVNPGEPTATTIQLNESVELLQQLGGTIVWEKDMLQLIALPNISQQAVSFISLPTQLETVSATTQHARFNPVADLADSYAEPTQTQSSIEFPFAEITAAELQNLQPSADTQQLYVSKDVTNSPGEILIPGITQQSQFAPQAELLYSNGQLYITLFSPFLIQVTDKGGFTSEVPVFPDVTLGPLSLEIAPSELGVAIGDTVVSLPIDTPVYTQITGIAFDRPLEISYFDQAVIRSELGRTSVENSEVHLVVTDNFWSSFQTPVTIPYVETTESISLAIRTRKQDLLPQLKTSTFNNCDLFTRGSVSLLPTPENPNQITYEAKDGATLCHGTELVYAQTNLSHMIHLQGANSAGRGLKLYVVSNNTNRTTGEHLFNTGAFESWIGLEDQPLIDSASQTITFETKAFSGISSINSLQTLDLYSLPISQRYLAEIQLRPLGYQPITNGWGQAEISRLSAIKYSIAVEPHSQGKNSIGTIILKQGFDSGWQARFVSEDSIVPVSLAQLFPYLFGEKLAHTQYNGWANAWQHDSESQLPGGTVIIWYWPQLLQTLGFAALLLTIFTCLVVKNRKK